MAVFCLQTNDIYHLIRTSFARTVKQDKQILGEIKSRHREFEMHAYRKSNLKKCKTLYEITMRCPKIILDWFVIYSLVACKPSNSSVPEEMTQMVVTTLTSESVFATQSTAPTLISTQIPDIVVNARQFNQIVGLKLEQVLKLSSPASTLNGRLIMTLYYLNYSRRWKVRECLAQRAGYFEQFQSVKARLF